MSSNHTVSTLNILKGLNIIMETMPPEDYTFVETYEFYAQNLHLYNFYYDRLTLWRNMDKDTRDAHRAEHSAFFQRMKFSFLQAKHHADILGVDISKQTI
jgi:hypothetical protein